MAPDEGVPRVGLNGCKGDDEDGVVVLRGAKEVCVVRPALTVQQRGKDYHYTEPEHQGEMRERVLVIVKQLTYECE